MVTRALPSAGIGFLRDTPNSHSKFLPCSCKVTFAPLPCVENSLQCSSRAVGWSCGILQGLVAPRTQHSWDAAQAKSCPMETVSSRATCSWSWAWLWLRVFLDPCFCVADLVQEALGAPSAPAMGMVPSPGWPGPASIFGQQWGHCHWILPVALNQPHSSPNAWSSETLASMARPMPCCDIQTGTTGSVAKPPVPPLVPGSVLHAGLSLRVASPRSWDGGPPPTAAQFPQQPATSGGTGVLWMSLVLLVWILNFNGT